ncbi:MAG: SH3 domain-containing protein [Deltaproteobacteria bacterium]|nr:MAG: SH3 domain-containing protein [Deltaproteobacteria bacterium]
MISLFLAAALAGGASIDLGGGPLPVQTSDSGDIRVGKHELPCGGGSCEVSGIDIKKGDGQQELVFCEHGVRDEITCMIYRLSGGKLVEVSKPEGLYMPSVSTTGGGFVLVTDSWRHRLYERVDKLTYADGKLTLVPQPLYSTAETIELTVQKTFQLLSEPGGQTIANTRPNSTIRVLGEHGTRDDWILVRLSSGITGWVSTHTLMEVCEEYGMRMMAG